MARAISPKNGKKTISTARATPSNSSSASSRLSWQPSQEANLNTATVGRWLVIGGWWLVVLSFATDLELIWNHLQLISSKPGPHLVIREDGSVFANEIR